MAKPKRPAPKTATSVPLRFKRPLPAGVTDPGIPIDGALRIHLTNGEVLEASHIEVRRRDGYFHGAVTCGPDGLTYTGELSLVQGDDPGALRIGARYHDESLGAVNTSKISFCRTRNDGRGIEVGQIQAGTADDARDGEDYRGQIRMLVNRESEPEDRSMVGGFVLTTAYADDYFPRTSSGHRVHYTGTNGILPSMGKFGIPREDPPGLHSSWQIGGAPPPPPEPPPPEPPPEPPQPPDPSPHVTRLADTTASMLIALGIAVSPEAMEKITAWAEAIVALHGSVEPAAGTFGVDMPDVTPAQYRRRGQPESNVTRRSE